MSAVSFSGEFVEGNGGQTQTLHHTVDQGFALNHFVERHFGSDDVSSYDLAVYKALHDFKSG